VATLPYNNAAGIGVLAGVGGAAVGGSAVVAAAAAGAGAAAVADNLIYSALMSAAQSEMYNKTLPDPSFKVKETASSALRNIIVANSNIIKGDTYTNRLAAATAAAPAGTTLGNATRRGDLHQFIDNIAVGSLAAESAVSGDNLTIYATAIPYIFKCLIKTYKDTLTATRDTAELILATLKAEINNLNTGILGTNPKTEEIASQANARAISANPLGKGVQEEADALLNGCIAVFRGFHTDTPSRGLDAANVNTFVNSSLARAVARATTINTTCEYIKFKVRIMNMREHFNNNVARNNYGLNPDPFNLPVEKGRLNVSANIYSINNANNNFESQLFTQFINIYNQITPINATINFPSDNNNLDLVLFNKNKIYNAGTHLFAGEGNVFNFQKFKVAYDNIIIHMARFCYKDIDTISIHTTETKNLLYSIFLKFLKTTWPSLKRIILHNAAHTFIYLYRYDMPYKERKFLDVVALLQLYEKTLNSITTGNELFSNIKNAAFAANTFDPAANAADTRNMLKKNLIVIMMKISHLFQFIDNPIIDPLVSHPRLIEYFNAIHNKIGNHPINAANYNTVFGFSSEHLHDDNVHDTNTIEHQSYHLDDF